MQIIENIMRQHIKLILTISDGNGKRYIKIQPKAEAHVPGAKGI